MWMYSNSGTPEPSKVIGTVRPSLWLRQGTERRIEEAYEILSLVGKSEATTKAGCVVVIRERIKWLRASLKIGEKK